MTVVVALLLAYALRDRPRTLHRGGLRRRSAVSPRSRARSCCCSCRSSPFPPRSRRAASDRRRHLRLAVCAVAAAARGRRPVGRLQHVAIREDDVRLDQRRPRARRFQLRSRVLRAPHRAHVPRAAVHRPCRSRPATSRRSRRSTGDRAFDYMGNHAGRVPIVIAARIGRTWSLYRPLDMLYYNLAEGKERSREHHGPHRVLPARTARDRGRMDPRPAPSGPALAARRARGDRDARRRRHLRPDPISFRRRTVDRDPRRRRTRGRVGHRSRPRINLGRRGRRRRG